MSFKIKINEGIEKLEYLNEEAYKDMILSLQRSLKNMVGDLKKKELSDEQILIEIKEFIGKLLKQFGNDYLRFLYDTDSFLDSPFHAKDILGLFTAFLVEATDVSENNK